eukprot:gene5646-9462_t
MEPPTCTKCGNVSEKKICTDAKNARCGEEFFICKHVGTEYFGLKKPTGKEDYFFQ